MKSEFWKNKIRAFLHDPPDKVIKILDHIQRRFSILPQHLWYYADSPIQLNIKKACKKFRWKYHEKCMKDQKSGKLIYQIFDDLESIPEIHYSDVYASSLQRIDLEKSKDNKILSSQFYKIYDGSKYIYVGDPIFRHPITGEPREFCTIRSVLPSSEPLDKTTASNAKLNSYDDKFNDILENKILPQEESAFSVLVEGNYYRDYLRIWAWYKRVLKMKLEEEFGKEFAEEFINLPAYSLAPDHTLFDHADVTSAIYGAMEKGTPALLLFKISPVQGFIKNARKERDLWAGSHMLAFLTLKAIEGIIKRYGPDAIIYPHLRENPFFEAYLVQEGLDEYADEKLLDLLKIASLPNKFLALVSWEDVNNIKEDIKESIHSELIKMLGFALSETLRDDILEEAINYAKHELNNVKDENEKDRLERALKCLESLKNLSKNEYEYLSDLRNSKLGKILLSHFSITVTAVPINMSIPKEERDKKESYNRLKEFVESLNLPEKIEKKYLDWLNFLGSIEVSENVARPFDLYSLYYEVLVELNAIESSKFEKTREDSGWKCTLCGEHLAIGGEDYRVMKKLWNKIHMKIPHLIKENEHLCPVCLVKRLYPKYLRSLNSHWKRAVPTIKSVSEVAMRKGSNAGYPTWADIAMYLDPRRNDNIPKDFEDNLRVAIENAKRAIKDALEKVKECLDLKDYEDLFDVEILYTENLRDEEAFLKTLGFGIGKSCSGLGSALSNLEKALSDLYTKIGKPAKYYALLMMDGDRMGSLLMGDDMKTVDYYLRPRVLAHVSDSVREKAKSVKRLLTPSVHAAISRSLRNFSVEYVPKIVESSRGELIYAGGDDILSLLPVDTAISTALELAKIFSKSWDGWTLLPGRSLSGGLLIAHYKHPLYDALDRVRALESKAKSLGRNALTVGWLKRSGTYYEATVGWEGVSKVLSISKQFAQGVASKRFLYHISQELDNLPPNAKAIKAFLKRESIRHLKRDLSEEIMDVLRHFRVQLQSLGEEDIKKINKLIAEGRLTVGALLEALGLESREDAERLYGEIVKEQLRGFVNFLKILVEAQAGDVE
ncbi:hypothetical protein A3L04_09075 [Thermococcus chitonophagus]|uniref:CRISPR-associated RAMP Cmr2 n=1 Tax=Thermococcus chitonophagus TaxID=54262 RepID=A0A160VVL0_9EURY|nr:type III-B CRISPR-associated protein Cas10/Cmr2 [Thermococcus chitonophagus]ASJ17206.1 hypothetical protein A3L04_09075 [Thermococcus chitonophagus]CUX77821.1 CRISPR-associated RAMP Cmr2 [Thermococcus chitonophagus]